MKKCQLLSVLIAILLMLFGCGAQRKEAGASTTSSEATSVIQTADLQQKLCFSVVTSENPGYTVISREELGGNTDAYLAYSDLAEVNILMDGRYVPLAESIRDGEITIPELFAFARMDSKKGFCQEEYKSEHGLTHFAYTYPECELLLVYDVYETPSGQQKLIEEVYISAISDRPQNMSHIYVDEDNEWGYFIDREDWGLDFEVSSASPTQIILNVTQHGGQQMGELFVENYRLYPMDQSETAGKVHGSIGQSKSDSDGLPIAIGMDTSGQITIDWSTTVGTLDAGNYYIKLSISDSYDQSKVHPLMTNYYDKQSYNISFTIP